MYKVPYKEPLILADLPWWPHNAYGIIDTAAFYVMNEKSWTISGTWKKSEDESQIDDMAGIFIRRGLHTGIVYRKPDMIMINFWYVEGDEEKYADKILFYKDEAFWNESHLFTLNWDAETNTYELWIDNELVHSEQLNGKLIHISKYTYGFPTDGRYYRVNDLSKKIYTEAPNQHEAINDPKIRFLADFKLEWEHQKDYNTNKDLIKSEYLIKTVDECLKDLLKLS